MVAGFEITDGWPHGFYYPDPFVTQYPARRDRRHVTFEDVQVGAANGGVQNSHNGVGGLVDNGFGDVGPCFLTGPLISERFHGGFPLSD